MNLKAMCRMDNICPECGRIKLTADVIVKFCKDEIGVVELEKYCPKWWAIRDLEMQKDCKRFAMKTKTECYIVACRRFDGGVPKPEKLMHDMLYFDIEDAEELKNSIVELVPKMAVFKCLIEVVEEVSSKRSPQ